MNRLVSASKFILDGAVSSPLLKQLFNWNTAISPTDLAQQLLGLSESYKRSGSVKDSAFVIAVPQLYQELSKFLETPEFSKVVSMLNGGAIIFTGYDFSAVQKVAFASPIDMSPYLSVVSRDLLSFASLFKALGVR
jgi:hypothetical protein